MRSYQCQWELNGKCKQVTACYCIWIHIEYTKTGIMIFGTYIWSTFVLLLLEVCDCRAEIYFPSDTYDYLLTEDTQVNTTVAEVIAVFKNKSIEQDSIHIVYTLEAVYLAGNCDAKDRFNNPVDHLFSIEDNTQGKIVLTETLELFGDYIGCSFKLVVSAETATPVHAETFSLTRREVSSRASSLSLTTVSTANETNNVVSVIKLRVLQNSTLCLEKPNIRLQIYNSSPGGAVYVLDPGVFSGAISSFDDRVIDGSSNKYIEYIHESSKLFYVPQDEVPDTFYISIKCSSNLDSKSYVNISITVILEGERLLTPIIFDEMLVITNKRLKDQRVNTLYPEKSLIRGWSWSFPETYITSHDNSSNFYKASLPNSWVDKSVGDLMLFPEYLSKFVDLNLKEHLPYTMSTIHSINVTLQNNIAKSHTIDWSNPPARTTLTYIIQIIIKPVEFRFENDYQQVNVYRNASIGSTIAVNSVPSFVSAGRKIVYYLQMTDRPVDGMQLEDSSGIFYVENDTLLQESSLGNFSMTMFAKDITEPSAEASAVSTIDLYLIDADVPSCVPVYCSQFDIEERCTGACGIGSPNRWCKWRSDRREFMGSSYATCSPNFKTCPDGTCDEIERQNIRICPQDCTDDVRGTLIKKTSNGIKAAYGTCKCDMLTETKSFCHCYNRIEIESPTVANASYITLHPAMQNKIVFLPDPVVASNTQRCDTVCIAVLSSAVFVFGALIIVGVVVCKRYPCTGRVAGTPYKPGLIGTPDGLLNTIPSEYVDDGFMLQRVKSEYDAKWEFPRTNLVLEDILGEGEFGRVMKSQALSIRGHTGYQTVAVKMLKNNATNAELQDLITELSLLKQVNHPNVIRLLGATTQKGPLFVIVEYCLHGSLKLFLRKHRKTVLPCDDYMGVDPEPPSISIGPRELVSFAWQVCKGMHYLASMKLVHRDLAARNVLVAEGLIAKISDFGLTRDIYEGDTYMKKSKSRMPVKWMAIEALYDNVYTIKSDIWSFGVLLWEIVTMGATPYPGLASERLYHILKNGYRMEKPDGCSDELFRIMQRCWQLVPTSRPSFFDLVDIFEKMLEKDSEYLDLSAELPIDSEDEEDRDDRPEAGLVFCPPIPQVDRGEATSLRILLSNASYSAVGGPSKLDETSFNVCPPEPQQESVKKEDTYYCGECTDAV